MTEQQVFVHCRDCTLDFPYEHAFQSIYGLLCPPCASKMTAPGEAIEYDMKKWEDAHGELIEQGLKEECVRDKSCKCGLCLYQRLRMQKEKELRTLFSEKQKQYKNHPFYNKG